MINLYQELLMDHYRHPRNRGTINNSDFTSVQHNPSCGDSVKFMGCIHKNKVTSLAFNGAGCVISQATASLLSEKTLNITVNDILVLDKDFVLRMIGMQLGPIRLKCALLPLQALQEGLSLFMGTKEAKR